MSASTPAMGSARWTLTLALVATLTLLWWGAPRGEVALGGALGVALLHAVPQPARRRRRFRDDLRAWLPALALGLATLAGITSLLALTVTGSFEPRSGLAWFARVLCLAGLALLPRTRPPALVLHGLVVLLGVWIASALAAGAALAGVPAALGVATLALTALGLLLAHRLELERVAETSVGTGIAPTPWGIGAPWLPVPFVALVALVPLALGFEFPRLTLQLAQPPRAPAPRVEPVDPGRLAAQRAAIEVAEARAARRAAERAVEFSPWIDLRPGRSNVTRHETIIARVQADRKPPLLLFRGAALGQLAGEGCFPLPRRVPQPFLTPNRRRLLRLEVELLRPQRNALFVLGQAVRFEGVGVRHLPRGPTALAGTTYPLRYQVTCQVAASIYAPQGAVAAPTPALLELPDRVRQDPALVALARRVAPGPKPHQRAVQAIDWLRRTCRYDLSSRRAPELHLQDLLRDFLLRDRRGVCEEFAVALTAILRLNGVPARVVAGYRAGEETDAAGRWVLRARDAHAWVEVPLSGWGWWAYDPTPAGPGTAGDRTDPRRLESVVRTGDLPSRPSSGGVDAAPPADEPPEASGEEPAEEAAASPAPGEDAALPPVTLALCLLLLAGGLVTGSALAAARFRARLRAEQLGPDPFQEAALHDDRERLFRHLERRGFDLDGAQTPPEFLSDRQARGSWEPLLVGAVEAYQVIRFSGRRDRAAGATLRRCLDGLPRLPQGEAPVPPAAAAGPPEAALTPGAS